PNAHRRATADAHPRIMTALDWISRPFADDGALALVERRSLAPGNFYVLLPPRDDIHRVRTTSADTSVSVHLLTNDTGCVWRHAFDPESGEARPFRSGYVNVDCEEEQRSGRPAAD